jgi:hypothetical protein
MRKNLKPAPTNDYKDVVATVQKYVDGIRIGSPKTCAEAFYENAVYFGIVNGAVAGGSVQTFYDFLNQNGKAPDVVAHIDVLAITPTTAVVRVDLEKDSIGADYNDYVTLLKVDGIWKVIAKVYHQFEG